jgi:hypothetical protein
MKPAKESLESKVKSKHENLQSARQEVRKVSQRKHGRYVVMKNRGQGRL